MVLVLVGLVAVAGITWGNYNYARQNPGGNDFLVHWMGSRAIVKDGISPYSDEVATRIQTFAYGRPAQPGEHELRVAYPLYSVIIFAPFALIDDFAIARAAWMTAPGDWSDRPGAGLSLSLYRWKVSPVDARRPGDLLHFLVPRVDVP